MLRSASSFCTAASAFCCSSRTARIRSAIWTCRTAASCFIAGPAADALHDIVEELHGALVVLRRLEQRVQHGEPDAVEIGALLRERCVTA